MDNVKTSVKFISIYHCQNPLVCIICNTQCHEPMTVKETFGESYHISGSIKIGSTQKDEAQLTCIVMRLNSKA
jgi:hypothetical protein